MSRTIKKPKTGGKAVSRHCKNHGGCEYCYSNRLIHTLKELDRTNLKLVIEENIDSSYDMLEFIYPEKLAYLDKVGYYG